MGERSLKKEPGYKKRLQTTGVTTLLGAVMLSGCGSSAESDEPAKETVTVTVDATGEAAPTTAGPAETATATASPTGETATATSNPEGGNDIGDRVKEKYESVTMPESLMPSINKFEELTYAEDSPELLGLYELYPNLRQKIAEHEIVFKQNVSIDALNESQAKLDAVFEGEFLTVTENGELTDEPVNIENIASAYQFNSELPNITSDEAFIHESITGKPNGANIFASEVVNSAQMIFNLKRVTEQELAVSSYFEAHPEEYTERLEAGEIVQSTVTAEDVLAAQYIIDPEDDSNINNINEWVTKARYSPEQIGGVEYTSHPVNFIAETESSETGESVTKYGLTILSEYDGGARLDTFVMYPHDNGYYDSVYMPEKEDFEQKHFDKPWFNIATVTASSL